MKLETQKIKGKDYVLVNERVKAFRSHENFKDMSIETEIVDMSENRVVMVARVKDSNGNIRASGHAEEILSKSGVNATSFLENCETSAVGRCLGFLGIGVDDSIATFEEVDQAIERQNKIEEEPEAKIVKEGKIKQSHAQAEEKFDWKNVVCPFPKHKNKKLGDIAEIDESFMSWMAGLDDIKSAELRSGVAQWLREKNNNGKQGFNRIA